MNAVAEQLYTVEEYFDFEKKSEIRHEFYEGQLIAMPGETTIANRIAYQLARFFDDLLGDSQNYLFFSHDVKLMVRERRIYRYSDFVVINAQGDHTNYVTEPVLVAEVLSDSTEDTDRERKKIEYFALPSLQYYLLIHQKEPLVELYSRQGAQWHFNFYVEQTDTIALAHFDTQLPLSDLYKKIRFSVSPNQ